MYFRALEIPLMFDMFFLFASGFRAHVCSIQDYWEGYKLFCYAYYSHSMQHEYDFQQSKLGSLLAYSICFFRWVAGMLPLSWHVCFDVQATSQTLRPLCFSTGQLVWRRHANSPLPSHHMLRTTCMQILPLVEMFCRWELQEDCGNLRALMHRFDSESELQSTELGRSLLCMLEDDDVGFGGFDRQPEHVVRDDPFAGIRDKLAAVGTAIQTLQHQVQGRLHSCGFMHTVSSVEHISVHAVKTSLQIKCQFDRKPGSLWK